MGKVPDHVGRRRVTIRSPRLEHTLAGLQAGIEFLRDHGIDDHWDVFVYEDPNGFMRIEATQEMEVKE